MRESPPSPQEGNMAVQKRDRIPEELQPKDEPLLPEPEDIVIRVGDKSYDIPNLTLKQYKKVVKTLENQPIDENTNELEALDFTKDFYYNLLKTEHPELKKEQMDDMPIYQYGAEFIIKLKMALFRIPLGS